MPDDVSDILEKYAPQQAGGAGDVADILQKYQAPDEVLNEQHPDISFGERLRQGNLGPNAESQRKDLLSQGFEVGGEGDDIQVRKPGEKPWRRVDPEGFDWMDILDLGNEATSAVTTTAGALSAGPLGAAGAAGGTEAARLGLANASGFDVGLEDVVTGVGSEALLGGASELGAQALGKVGKWGLSKLRGAPVPAAAPPSGLLKPIAAEAAEAPVEAAAVKPEVQAFKEAMSPGAAPAQAAEGLLKTPDELDAILKPGVTDDPYSPSYRVRQRPHEPTTPPGIDPNWTPGHQASGTTARKIQEAGRHAPPASPHGPVTLATSSRDQVRKLLKDAGDDDLEIFYLKGPKGKAKTADPTDFKFRHFKSARLSEKAPKFNPLEGDQVAKGVVLEGKNVGDKTLAGQDIKSQLKELTDTDVIQIARDSLQKKLARNAKLTKAEKAALEPDVMEYMPRAEIERLVWGAQAGVVKGKHGLTPRPEGWYEDQAVKHNTVGLWEQTGKTLDEGDWRAVNADKVLEIRNNRTGDVFRFSEEGKPVRAGSVDEIPPPTEVMASPEPGVPPRHFKLEEEGAPKVAGKAASPASTRATPEELAARGILPPGPIGKAAEFAEGLLQIPKKIAGGIQEFTGLGPKAAKGLMIGADLLGTGGVGTAGRIGGGLAVKGMKAVDRLLQPGGLERAIQSAPDAVRPALEGILHQLQSKGEAAGKAAIFISVRSAGGGPLRDWLSSEDTEPRA
jgi:hypothetical protein